MFRATVVLVLISVVVGANYADDEGRIVGGKGMLIEKVPCVASFQKRGVHKCGAIIISPNVVLTAAHCIAAMDGVPIGQLSVRAGSSMWSVGGQSVKIKKMITHPHFDAAKRKYDVGFAILSELLEYGTTVKTCEMTNKFPKDGENALICGWGLKKEGSDMVPNMLQSANVTTISKAKCSSEDYEYRADIFDSMFCAKSEGKDACQGDSGGPIIIDNLLVGITSFGVGCGREKYPGVYIAVAGVANWIKKQIVSYGIYLLK